MHFIKINTNPYKWGIFYLLVQALVFVLMAIYVYQYDLRQFQLPVGLVILCLAITFILLTAQGRENYSG